LIRVGETDFNPTPSPTLMLFWNTPAATRNRTLIKQIGASLQIDAAKSDWEGCRFRQSEKLNPHHLSSPFPLNSMLKIKASFIAFSLTGLVILMSGATK
jgi:hypothetical protein